MPEDVKAHITGVVFQITSHMVFTVEIEIPNGITIVETSPSGLTQALAQYLGILTATALAALGGRRSTRLPWSPARSPASASSRT